MQTDDLERNEAPGGDYNRLPYPSMPFAYTQPSHLAALASLFAFKAAAADRARVLELGCASGGNIIPLAARYPRAQFLGIDLSSRHVDDACRRISQLGLQNIEVRQGDVATVSFAGSEFDYVICHGLLSWVPKDAQEAIFRVCGESLAANGVAAISYNVLPGWHLRSVVRDICLHHVGTNRDPVSRAREARLVLQQVAQSASEANPYGLLVRKEADRIARLPASYILGEFLAADNEPCHFHQFVARAGKCGLTYLCEGDLASSIPETLFPGTEDRIKALAGPDRVAYEQYKDFFSGRPFRRSILIRTNQADSVQSKPSADCLGDLHFACKLVPDVDQSTQQVSTYRDAHGRAITAHDPSVRNALAKLENSFPATLTLTQLTEPDRGSTLRQQDTDAGKARVCEALFRLLVNGQASVSSLPITVERATSTRPRVWSVARVEAASRQPWVTNLHHDAIPLPPEMKSFVSQLDGNHDRQMLRAQCIEALRRDEIRLPQLQCDEAKYDNALLLKVTDEYIEATLQFLARNALLGTS